MTTPIRSSAAGGDAAKFVAAVEAIYGAAVDPSRWPHALDALANVFGDTVANLAWQRDDGTYGLICSHGLDPRMAAAYERDGWWQRDIRMQRGMERAYTLPGDAVTDRHLVAPEELETHPFFTEFNARYGLRWLAGTGISPDPHVVVTMSVQRENGKPPYSDEELATLTRLAAHAEKSLRLSVRLFDAELANTSLGQALTRLGIALFALDTLGRVVFANPAAERLPRAEVEVVDGHLRLGTGTDRAVNDAAITQALAGNAHDFDPKPILLHRPPPDRPLVVYFLPIAMGDGLAEQFLTRTRLIVMIIEPSTDGPGDPSVVRDLLGLTLSEARVAALVGSGVSPRQAAEKLGITEETARTVLKRVFSKIGVSRQSELSALLTKLVLR